MSFSTPKIAEPKPTRRSKRTSDENGLGENTTRYKTRQREDNRSKTAPVQMDGMIAPPVDKIPGPIADTANDDNIPTRIALPFADTPVIRRNKAMREGKSGKGERRSSLGLRGRRASSLIESGNSSGGYN
jgi:kinetochore protein Mis13/DSN1